MRISRKYLPSNKFLVSLALAIMIILIAIALNYSKANSIDNKNNSTSNVEATSSVIATLNNTDTDKDGVPDWQEVLYGTDPKNPDTDKDGTTDGEEIKLNRDPLKANTSPKGQEPNDKINPELIANEQKVTSDYENLNPIEKMARNLISNIIASQPSSGAIDPVTEDSLVQKAIDDLPQKQYSGITKESDLNLISMDPKTLYKNLLIYREGYYEQTELLRKIFGQDLSIINDDMTAEKPFEKEIVVEIINKYQNIIDNLIKLPLPGIPGSYGAIYHLATINDLEKLIQIDNDIIKSENDTSIIFADIAEYNNTMNDLVLSLGQMDNFFMIQRQ